MLLLILASLTTFTTHTVLAADVPSPVRKPNKRSCARGLLNHDCALFDMDSLMSSRQFLGGGYSPGKRASDGGAALDMDTLMRSRDFLKGGNAPGKRSGTAADMDTLLTSRDFLNSGLSPGKRAANSVYDDVYDTIPPGSLQDSDDMLAELAERRQVKQLLQTLLAGAPQKQNVKRTCNVRLGGHCNTEALDRAANQYYYLLSPDSPGRRRRSARRANQNQAR